jgi:hypothetical protein
MVAPDRPNGVHIAVKLVDKAYLPLCMRWECRDGPPRSPMRVRGEGGVVEVLWHGRVFSSSGVRSPSRVVGKFPTDYIFSASGEVVDMVEAFEEARRGNRAGKEKRVRVHRRFGKEHAVKP